MATKSELLHMLEAARGELVSGEQLAAGLGVSRAAVWKAAEVLRREGHRVESVPGGGYRLARESDRLSAEGIAAALGREIPLRVLEETDSTNLEAKRWALEGAPHGALVVAVRQTGGRGRMGRGFASPPGGIYMSMVLRPQVPVEQAVLVTTQAAVAACETVESLCGLRLEIKWVNDLFYRGRKVCGILSEAGTGFESGSIEYIVVGMGINYTTPQAAFGPELQSVAASLYPNGGAPVPRGALVAGIYTRLLDLFGQLPGRDFLDAYRGRSLVLGRQVTVLASPPYTALAEGIDDDARLLVRLPGGERRALQSGEISVKLDNMEVVK